MNKLHSILITCLMVTVAVLFFFLAFGSRGLVDMYNLEKEVERLAQENLNLEQENAQLRRTMYRLLEDPAYLESVARKELGMVAEDEFVIDFKKGDQKAEK